MTKHLYVFDTKFIKEWDYNKNIIDPNKITMGSGKKVWWKCKNGHEWQAIISSRNRGIGCNSCKKNISKISNKWLNELNISIKNREITLYINNKRIIVDAYIPETNTVYEFYGDYWHGNPKIYNLCDYNKKVGRTFGYLYRKTLNREKLIKEYNFNLITIWEYDFKNTD